MESTNKFNINTAVDKWIELNCQNDEFLPEDKLEIRSDLLSSFDDIVEEYSLTPKEAFKIACNNMGDRFDWKGEMKQANQDNFQLKKVVLLFGGVIFYIFSYHFILCVNRLILLLSKNVLGNEMEIAVANVSTFFNLIYLISVSGIVAIYFWHNPVKWLFKKITGSTCINIVIVFLTLFSIILERYLGPKVMFLFVEKNYRTFFFNQEVIFRYVYFIIIMLGYILLFRKHMKKYNRE